MPKSTLRLGHCAERHLRPTFIRSFLPFFIHPGVHVFATKRTLHYFFYCFLKVGRLECPVFPFRFLVRKDFAGESLVSSNSFRDGQAKSSKKYSDKAGSLAREG